MNISKNGSTTIEPSQPVKTLIPEVRIFLLSSYPLLFILSGTSLIIVLKYLGKATGPSIPFMRVINLVTLFGVVLGIPAEWITIYYKYLFPKFMFYAIARLIVYITHFGSSFTCQTLIGAMVLHRYNKFKKQDVDGFSKHTSIYIAVAMSLGLSCLGPILWEIWGCMLVRKHVFEPCTTYTTVGTITVLIATVCIIIRITTQKLTTLIKIADERANKILQMKRTTNTARVRATVRLIVLYIIEWVPYGIIRFIMIDDFATFQSMKCIAHMLSTVVHLSVPLVYYKMDGKFEQFVKNTFKAAIKPKEEGEGEGESK